MSMSVESRAFTQSVTFAPDRNRQYLTLMVEGSATVAFEGGDKMVVEESYEPLVVPIGGFTISDITNRVVVVSNASTLEGIVHSTRLAPSFNGISQYALIPSMAVATGEDYTISFYFSCQNQATFDVLGFSGSFSDFIVISPNEIQVRNTGERLYFDGSFQDGKPHKVVIRRASGITTVSIDGTVLNERDSKINNFGFNFDIVGSQALANYALGFVWSISLNDGSIYNFPMDDGWQNNPTMRNAGSGADGTFVNMTEAAWQEITL